jgi:hypothetical protein
MKTGVFFTPEQYAKAIELANKKHDVELIDALRDGSAIHDIDPFDNLQECICCHALYDSEASVYDGYKFGDDGIDPERCPDCQPEPGERREPDYDAMTISEQGERARKLK